MMFFKMQILNQKISKYFEFDVCIFIMLRLTAPISDFKDTLIVNLSTFIQQKISAN